MDKNRPVDLLPIITATGPIGGANTIPVITVNEQGQVTALTSVAAGAGATIAATSTTGTIAAGLLVYENGWDATNKCVSVAVASNTSGATLAQWLTTSALAASGGAVGTISKTGTVVVSGANPGDQMYLATAGAAQITPPTAAGAEAQIIGVASSATLVQVDLASVTTALFGTANLQNASVTAVKANLAALWQFTAASPSITLGKNGVGGAAGGMTVLDGANPGVIATTLSTAALSLGATGTTGTFGLKDTGAGLQTVAMTGAAAGPQVVLGATGSSGSQTFLDTAAGATTLTLAGASAGPAILAVGTAPQAFLGIKGSVAGAIDLAAPSGNFKGRLIPTTLAAADKTWTLPNNSGVIPVGSNGVTLNPAPSVANTNPANMRFGNAKIATGQTNVTVTVTGVPDSNTAAGSAVFAQINFAAAGIGLIVASNLKANVASGTLTITLVDLITGNAIAASSDMFVSYLLLY